MRQIKVSEEILMDAEQIAVGGYAPLGGFLRSRDFKSVLSKMRLNNGQVWPIPVVLDVSEKTADVLRTGDEIMLTDGKQARISLLVEEIYVHDKSLHCRSVYGTGDNAHPGVLQVQGRQNMLIGGKVQSVIKPLDYSLRKFALKPEQTKAYFKKKAWRSVAAFHTRNVVHRAHEYLQRCAMEYTDGLLIHPVSGFTKKGDFSKELIIRSYQKLIKNYYPQGKVLLAALGIGMKFAGPREAVFHALVRRNYGCTHIVIGRDHAGAGGYYEKYAAHKIFSELPQLGIIPLLFKGPFYCQSCEGVATESTCGHAPSHRREVSGTLLRQLVKKNKNLPGWLVRPEVADLISGFKGSVFYQG